MNAQPTPESPSSANLRERARTRLQASAPSFQMAKDPSSALRVLFDLAANPASAHEALALLHELQVHQVELELQREELLSSRNELESAWAKEMLLNDAAPHAQMLLSSDACLLECNAKALTFLNPTRVSFIGKPLTNWVAPNDAQQVSAWLGQALQGVEVPSLLFNIRSMGSVDRPVCAAVRRNPNDPGLLLAWVEAPAALSACSAA